MIRVDVSSRGRLVGSYSSRRGIGIGKVFVALFILVFAGVGYLIYVDSVTPHAGVSISWGGSGCGTVDFTVTNHDNKVYNVWQATLQSTPSESGISSSPVSATVGRLGPQGQYEGTFSVIYAGTPTGTYHFTVNLVNGSQTIATSNSIGCSLN